MSQLSQKSIDDINEFLNGGQVSGSVYSQHLPEIIALIDRDVSLPNICVFLRERRDVPKPTANALWKFLSRRASRQSDASSGDDIELDAAKRCAAVIKKRWGMDPNRPMDMQTEGAERNRRHDNGATTIQEALGPARQEESLQARETPAEVVEQPRDGVITDAQLDEVARPHYPGYDQKDMDAKNAIRAQLRMNGGQMPDPTAGSRGYQKILEKRRAQQAQASESA